MMTCEVEDLLTLASVFKQNIIYEPVMRIFRPVHKISLNTILFKISLVLLVSNGLWELPIRGWHCIQQMAALKPTTWQEHDLHLRLTD